MSNQLQQTILQKLVNDENYCRKVLPFIKSEYFDAAHKTVYRIVLDFISKYNKLPTKSALEIEFQGDDTHVEDVQFNAGLAHSHTHFKTVADWMMTGVRGTSVGKGPPEPVGTALMRSTTSMPATTRPNTV